MRATHRSMRFLPPNRVRVHGPDSCSTRTKTDPDSRCCWQRKSVGNEEQAMHVKRAGSQPSAKGPEAWFTGTVRIDPLFQAQGPQRVSGASVTFEPGARTAWHTHPLGQTL